MGPTLHQLARKGFLYVYVTAGFIIVLDTLHVSLEPIAAADHLTGAKNQSSEPIIWLILSKQI